MPDEQLKDMLHGLHSLRVSKPKDPAKSSALDSMIEEKLQELTDRIIAERPEQPADKLSPAGAKRQKVEGELREAIDLKNLTKQLREAFNTIVHSKKYLPRAEYAMVIGELAKGATYLEEISWEILSENNLMTIMELSDETMASIELLASATYEERLYRDSQALWTLLTILNPDDIGYWFRLAIAAQQNEQYELALKAYAAAAIIDPDFFGAHLFSCECYLEIGMYDDAEVEYAEVKRLAEENLADERIQNQAGYLKELIEFVRQGNQS